MFDIVITRQPGRPCASLGAKRVCRTTEEEGRQMRHRESDSLIVPVKAGNAAGGKEATHGSAVRGNTNRSQKRGTNGNETAPHSGESRMFGFAVN